MFGLGLIGFLYGVEQIQKRFGQVFVSRRINRVALRTQSEYSEDAGGDFEFCVGCHRFDLSDMKTTLAELVSAYGDVYTAMLLHRFHLGLFADETSPCRFWYHVSERQISGILQNPWKLRNWVIASATGFSVV